MAINFDNYLGGLDQALVLRERRSEIIASNIANADTPGYKSKDIDFKSALSSAMGTGSEFKKGTLKMTTSDSQHIQMSQNTVSSDVMYRNPYQPSLDGNTVDSGIEKTEFTKNSIHYQATLNFLTGKFKGLTKAIKGQ